jgi:uncharacterized membrane protein
MIPADLLTAALALRVQAFVFSFLILTSTWFPA